MPSSLEIAQSAVLRPIDEIAADLGLLPEEVEPYGRFKAKIDPPSSTGWPRGPTRS
jgi:formate--tetrahydrofolate ligase